MTDTEKRDELWKEWQRSFKQITEKRRQPLMNEGDFNGALTEYDTWLRREMKQSVMMADIFDSASCEDIEQVERAIDTAGKEKQDE